MTVRFQQGRPSHFRRQSSLNMEHLLIPNTYGPGREQTMSPVVSSSIQKLVCVSIEAVLKPECGLFTHLVVQTSREGVVIKTGAQWQSHRQGLFIIHMIPTVGRPKGRPGVDQVSPCSGLRKLTAFIGIQSLLIYQRRTHAALGH